MKRTPFAINLTLPVICIVLIAPHISYAGAFSLYTEGSTVAIGNFAAGIAAEGADASIGWYNPAGLILIKKPELVFSAAGVLPSTRVTGFSTYTSDGVPPYYESFSHLQGGEHAAVPAFHYAHPLGEQAAFGFSVVAPFGLSTNWPVSSPVRYSATSSDLVTVTASPELAGKLTEQFSIGAGLDLQGSQVTYNTVLGSPAQLQYLQSIGGTQSIDYLDSISKNTGTSFGIGFHAGVLGQFNDQHTRIGVNYQSQIQQQYRGYSLLTGRVADLELWNPIATFQSDDLYSNPIDLPAILTVSGYQDINQTLAILGSVVYTGWSCFKQIQLNNIAAFSEETNELTLLKVTADQNYRDTWRVAVGANYQLNDQWMVRAGGGYDQTPTVSSERDIRLPDADRWALSIGTHYQPYPNVGLDFGYTYLFANQASPVNKLTQLGPLSSNTINATAKNSAQVVGLQAVVNL